MKTKIILAVLLFAASAAFSQVSHTPLVQVVPGPGLPEQVQCMKSNNNLDLTHFDGKLFLGFRTAPTHFAGKKVKLYIMSTTDEERWDFETEVFIGADMREPRFLVLGDKLMFYFFEAGKNPLAFEPKQVWAMERKGLGDWTKPVKIEHFGAGCVLWRAKVREGKAYISSYCGGESMYKFGNESIGIHFLTTEDGYNFEPVAPGKPVVALGGSETAFEFDEDGTLYTSIRNEGGDGISWKSKVCKAEPDSLSEWRCKESEVYKFDSPLMFRHGEDIYLIARRNVDGAYDKEARWLPNSIETLYYLARYWFTKKRTALYKLDKANLEFNPVLDFPSAGDTAFPGLVKIDEDSYLMYNYSSAPPPEGKDRFWLSGQLSHTQIYKTVIEFK